MKIVCDTAKLAKLCSNVQRTVSNKSTIPAIEGILLNALGDSLRLTGYDLEVGTETYLEADVDDSGSIILNAKNFCDILRLLPGETVSIESDERNICKIKSGETEYSIIGTSADEYPDLPTISGGFPIVIQQGMLKDMIRKTIFSVSVSERNPVHCGVKFEISEGKIVLVAVDGARLAIRREEIDYTGDPVSFVVPAKTLGEIEEASVSVVLVTDGNNPVTVFANGETFTLEEMSTVVDSDYRWEFGEYATVNVKKAGGLAEGPHHLVAVQHIAPSYMPFPWITECTADFTI